MDLGIFFILTPMKKVVIIGAGIGGLSAAAVLAKAGFHVTVVEKNEKAGGRINSFEAEGFRFDMGPSWYWMPETFENFYNLFGYTTSDFYDLKRLDPSYKVFFQDEAIEVPANYSEIRSLFERFEPGSAGRLDQFLSEAKYKYDVGMSEFVWKPGKSLLEFFDLKVLKSVFKLQMFSSIKKAVSKVVSHDKLRQILEFPILFLGATPKNTPALYSLMNYADIKLGTWYPMGGMYKIAEAFYKIALSQNVEFIFNDPVIEFQFKRNEISHVITKTQKFGCDYVLANADYHFIDQQILPKKLADYNSKYWDSRKMAPSSLLVFIGLNKKMNGLTHHNLFFDTDFDKHASQIYNEPAWPENPLFYVCCPSITDPTVAPSGQENLFLLIPIAPDLKDSAHFKEKYLDIMINRIEHHTNCSFKEDIIFKKYFSVGDFKTYYNSFKGNAYGLANTLDQTAILKPSLKSKKVSNLYFSGQLTTPGPGLPPSIISGQVAADQIIKRESTNVESI